jgi:DNA-binding MarR family transcriptional regulator
MSEYDDPVDSDPVRAMARAWVRAAAELTWMGSRADRVLELDSLEGRIMTLLVRHPWVMSTLREAVGVDRRVMSRVIRRLDNRGWVAKIAPGNDGRHLVIDATSVGQQVWRVAEDRRVDILTDLIGEVTTDAEAAATAIVTRRLTDMVRRFDRLGFWDPRFYRRAKYSDRGVHERVHGRPAM